MTVMATMGKCSAQLAIGICALMYSRRTPKFHDRVGQLLPVTLITISIGRPL